MLQLLHTKLQLTRVNTSSKSDLTQQLQTNTKKVSYSCLPNIKTEISRHNKKVLTSADNLPPSCNCRDKSSCPLPGKCSITNIVYQATVNRRDHIFPPHMSDWPASSNLGGSHTRLASGTRSTGAAPRSAPKSGASRTRTSPTTSPGTSWGEHPPTTKQVTNTGCAFWKNLFIFYHPEKAELNINVHSFYVIIAQHNVIVIIL